MRFIITNKPLRLVAGFLIMFGETIGDGINEIPNPENYTGGDTGQPLQVNAKKANVINKLNKSNSAFPIYIPDADVLWTGLTKRELFASKNMAAMIGASSSLDCKRMQKIAQFSVLAADALIEALNEKEEAK